MVAPRKPVPHLTDRVRDRRRAAAADEQAHRPGIRCHISTINDPESPLFRKRLPFVITIWPVKVCEGVRAAIRCRKKLIVGSSSWGVGFESGCQYAAPHTTT
jgi:hypothetical protein